MKFFHSNVFKYLLAFLILGASCNKKKNNGSVVQLTAAGRQANVRQLIVQQLAPPGKIKEDVYPGTRLYAPALLQHMYKAKDFVPQWSNAQQWLPIKDSLLQYIRSCEREGLFKTAYHFDTLQLLTTKLQLDSLHLQPEALWAKADILLTDACMHVLEDLAHGRLHADNLAWKHNRNKQQNFFEKYFNIIKERAAVFTVLQQVQPGVEKYQSLIDALPGFLKNMNRQQYTYLVYPFKDSSAFYKNFVTRLAEEGITKQFPQRCDSAAFGAAVSSYQLFKKLPINGKLTSAIISRLNDTGPERFKRIAITLDRYKQLGLPMPDKYIWVNLPSYYLQVWQKDSVVLLSKVIIGKPHTATPLIKSAISDLVIYPTWTVPNSIITKEILPGLKKNSGYLASKGLALFNYNGEPVNPYTVEWDKFDKSIPYMVRQSSGDENALGVIKFNFKNPYSVYLHDTNQRYLFKNKSRSLSHGCVRVQDWEKLAFYIIRNDSLLSTKPDSLKLRTDSLTSWLAMKQKRVVSVGNRLPLFIGYYTCAAIDGNITFYDDVYGKDKAAREKYAAFK